MIFKRRERRGLWDQARDLVSPKKGWRRGFKYIGRRVQRLPDTPHRIAIGFACGVMASFSPFFTLHIIVAVALAMAVRGNLIAAAFGTIFGNPISFPLIAAASLKLGNWMLGRSDGVEDLETLSWEYVSGQPFAFLESIFTPYLVGGLAPGLICSVICYYLLRPVIARFQERRRTTLEARARELIARRRGATRQGARAAPLAEAAAIAPMRPRPALARAPRPAAPPSTPESNAG